MALKWTKHSDLAIKRTGEVLSRQEYLDWMTFKGGRVPFTEFFGPLLGMKENWEAQGATPEELDFSAFKYRIPTHARVPVSTYRMGGSSELIYEDDTVIRYLDDLGRTLELQKGCATIPLPTNFPVKTMDDWLKIKPKYQFCESRFRDGWEAHAKQAIADGRILGVGIPGGFDEPRQLLGEEGVCIACFEQPELIHDILTTIGDTAYKVLDRVSAAVQIDKLSVHEDMAGKSGPLFGPSQVLEFIKPYYRKIWDMLENRGAILFDQDSDGDMRPVIEAFLECGINSMHPIEPAAGMDLVELRKTYGKRLILVGGLNKFALTKTTAEVEAELEAKVPFMIQSGGGCMLSLDHRIPAEVTLENYRFYIKKIWEIIEREESAN